MKIFSKLFLKEVIIWRLDYTESSTLIQNFHFFFIIINFVRSLVVKISYLAFKDVKIIVEIGKATPTCKSMGL